jgi:Permuted papain-like amidase enzyme, YaeF/YiiX, C92 family
VTSSNLESADLRRPSAQRSDSVAALNDENEPAAARSSARWRTPLLVALAVLVLLWIPDPSVAIPTGPAARPFAWDANALFSALQRRHAEATIAGCGSGFERELEGVNARIGELEATTPAPEDPRWDALETALFELFASAGGCPARLDTLIDLRRRIRALTKTASREWPHGQAARDRVYRLLYGSRAALEELLLQQRDDAPTLEHGTQVRSAAPSLSIEGVQVHSGDILLSRGGAPTSAFIARGNDYPGNFSHVALVHVDEVTGVGSVIEAHIERGVAITDAAGYLGDPKLRIAVLRLREDHPALVDDPSLPHRVATTALAAARARHIPYDFAMDIADHRAQFCSEVASAAYLDANVVLWDQLSTFSSGGLARWMAQLGVRHLQTQAPADLEYDPQLEVVAEWHDPQTLLDDHIDNATIDAMLERAEAGAELDYDARMLPLARVLKLYSAIRVLLGGEGPIPEGMGATVALRAQWLAERHAAIRERVREGVAREQAEHGRTPPYWELVELARAAAY